MFSIIILPEAAGATFENVLPGQVHKIRSVSLKVVLAFGIALINF